ncbi:hypothetical protein ACFP2F_20680 [Hymenobacter artigasi]|uniref:Lipoprotein n=1 Tax=Hymenobacter artigasi TaxID=2719616 RepID=A0ABX1HQT8_9BACT|nr:hypothetical protein [Hymenobacter artigasi]NKI91582.1 hypothetical protein [Hymenobacter artigasi]
MPHFSRHPAALLALLLLAHGLLLPGCAPPNPTAAAGAPPAATPPAFPFGHRVDSLNGIAGHTFGETPSTFPHLRLLPQIHGIPEGPTRAYASTGTTGWFDQHRTQVNFQFYYFLDGKFYAFATLGDAAVLRPEATALFGPGQAQGPNQIVWEGRQARAVYTEEAVGAGLEGRLDVLSKPLEAALMAEEQAQRKAENPQ